MTTETVNTAITISNMRCICQLSDAELRKESKRRNIPLQYARAVKCLHRKFKIHKWGSGGQ